MKKRERSLCLIKNQLLVVQGMHVFCWAELACTTRQGGHPLNVFPDNFPYPWHSRSFLEMIDLAAASFPAAVYEPPPESASSVPALNMNLGGVSLSLGGPAGTGVYRTSGETSGLQAEGIRDGMRSLLGKVKQGVDRIGLQ
jgi:hypothetical protein